KKSKGGGEDTRLSRSCDDGGDGCDGVEVRATRCWWWLVLEGDGGCWSVAAEVGVAVVEAVQRGRWCRGRGDGGCWSVAAEVGVAVVEAVQRGRWCRGRGDEKGVVT
nr:hypothetical protein [Tanacetum cinerariifolium]